MKRFVRILTSISHSILFSIPGQCKENIKLFPAKC
jgi:hypothetical protein